MGAIIGSLIGQKYAEKIRKDKFEARMIEPHVMDYLTNPKTPIDDEFGNFLIERAAQHMSGEAKKQWQVVVDKARQYKTATRAAEQAQRAGIPATANPDSIAPQAAPNNAGGIAMPDAVQGNAGMMSQPPQVPVGIQGIASLPSPSPYTQKKTIDAPVAGQSIDPNSGAPPPVSGLPSPGMSTVAPVNSPSQTPPANYFQRAPGRIGEAAAALEAPGAEAKMGRDVREYAGKKEADYALYEKKFKQVSDFISKQTTNSGSEIEWTIDMDQNGMPRAREDRGVPLPQMYLGSQLPANVIMIGGAEKTPDGTYTVLRYANGKMKALANAPVLRPGFAPDENGLPSALQYNPRVPGSAAAAGVQPMPTFNPRLFNTGTGVGLSSAQQIQAGSLPAPIPGTVGTGSPTTSVQNIPGQLPQTTTRTRGGASAGVPRTATASANPNAANPSAINDNSPIAVNYRDWVAGKRKLSDKEQTAASNYASSHGLPTPMQLSTAGQANLQNVDAVFREIEDATKILNRIKGDPYLGIEYEKYKLGNHTPYDELFTKLSFEGLRSAAAALKGNGSRAYPVIQRAFEHVPTLDRLGGLKPDSVSLLKDKLKAMRDVLNDTRTTVMEDETKSGVVPPGITPPSSGTVNMKAPNGQVSPVPADQVEHYKSLGATVVP